MLDLLMDKAIENFKYRNIQISEYIARVSEVYFKLKYAHSCEDLIHGSHTHYLQFPLVIPYYQNGKLIGYIRDIVWECNDFGGGFKYNLEGVE